MKRVFIYLMSGLVWALMAESKQDAGFGYLRVKEKVRLLWICVRLSVSLPS